MVKKENEILCAILFFTGGIADFSLIEVIDETYLEVKNQCMGGQWGGNAINTAVWKIMEELLSADVIDEFKKQTSDYLEMESNIELKKRDLSADNKLILTMYPSLAAICKEKTGQTYKQLVEASPHANKVKVRTGKIIFEKEMIETLFEETVKKSFSVMDELLRIGSQVQDIILVGGFAESGILQKKFQEKYQKYRVIIPTDPGLAVLKGAVIFGHKSHIIKSRVCPHTYGVEVLQFGSTTDTKMKKKVISGITFCSGGLKTIVTKGTRFKVEELADLEVVSPSNRERRLFLRFYQTDNPSIEDVTEDDCIGRVNLRFGEAPEKIPVLLRIVFKFGEIEMYVSANTKRNSLSVRSDMNFMDSF